MALQEPYPAGAVTVIVLLAVAAVANLYQIDPAPLVSAFLLVNLAHALCVPESLSSTVGSVVESRTVTQRRSKSPARTLALMTRVGAAPAPPEVAVLVPIVIAVLIASFHIRFSSYSPCYSWKYLYHILIIA